MSQSSRQITAWTTACALFSLTVSGCIPTTADTAKAVTNPATNPATQDNAGASATSASGPKAARVVFSSKTLTGSFNPTTLPSTAVPGGGYKVVRLFNPDGSLLATRTSETSVTGTWPQWIDYIEVMISGTSNVGATDSACARFATDSEGANVTCDVDLNPATPPVPCGASEQLFRVSEYDCSGFTGNGGPNDGVTIRIVLNRDPSKLAPSENLLMNLEFAASGINMGPADPTICFIGGKYEPTNPGCADMVWQVFVKHNPFELVQPFLMLTPPIHGAINKDTNSAGGNITSKQFIIPLAGDAGLKVIQLSRISGLDREKIKVYCGNQSDTALCVGMVFHTLTLYRI